MKNAFKRLFSMMLAVVLLVSIVPFQASAKSNFNVTVCTGYLDENGKVKTNDDAETDQVKTNVTDFGKYLNDKFADFIKELDEGYTWYVNGKKVEGKMNESINKYADRKGNVEVVAVYATENTENPEQPNQPEQPDQPEERPPVDSGDSGDATPVTVNKVTVKFVTGRKTFERTAYEVADAQNITYYNLDQLNAWFKDCADDNAELKDYHIANGVEGASGKIVDDTVIFEVAIEKNEPAPEPTPNPDPAPVTVDKVTVKFVSGNKTFERTATGVENAQDITYYDLEMLQKWFNDCAEKNDRELKNYHIADGVMGAYGELKGDTMVFTVEVMKNNEKTQEITLTVKIVDRKGDKINAYTETLKRPASENYKDNGNAWIEAVLGEHNKKLRDYDVVEKLTKPDKNGNCKVTLTEKSENNRTSYIVYFKEGKHVVATYTDSTKNFKDLKVKDIAANALKNAQFEKDYRGNTYEIDANLSKLSFETSKSKYDYEVTISVKEVKKDNVTIRFTYDGDKVGEATFRADHPNKDSLTKKIAQSKLEELKLDSKYELKTDKRGNLDGVRFDADRDRFTVELDRKASKQKLDMKVYVDDKKVSLKNSSITVYSGEDYRDRHDLDQMLSRAMGDKYDRYDYDYNKTKTSYDKKNNELTVKLYTLKHDSNKRDYEIYLDIYTNGNEKKPTRTVKITNGIAKDGIVKLSEAKGIVKEYFSAKNKDGIDYEGLWLDADKFNRRDREDSIDVRDYHKNHKTVHIAIKADNVVAKKESSNPKTGDTIYMTVTVMAISATALVGAYIFNKKRLAK